MATMKDWKLTRPAMSREVEFFYDNAPYSWDAASGQTEAQGRLETAQDLAMAEQTAKERGWWSDLDFDPTQDAPGDQTLTLYTDGYENGMADAWAVAAVGGIEPNVTDERRRVFAAQLALEAFEDERVNDARVGGSA